MATLYEYCNSPSPSLSSAITTNRWTGESLTPLVSHLNTYFRFFMRKAAGGTGNISFRLYLATSGDLPTGSPISTLDYDISTLPTTAAWITLALPPVQLFAGQKYAIIACVTAASPSTSAYLYGVSGYPYSRGKWVDSFNQGASWIAASTSDVGFEDWGEPTIIDTDSPSDETSLSATLNGILNDATGIDERGFDYGTVSGTYTDEVTESGSFSPGAFGLVASGLSPGTGYYYRAKVHHTSYGWLYGQETGVITTLDPTWALFEEYDAAGTTNHGFSGNTWRGETFPAISGHQLRGVKIKVYRGASPAGTLTVSIRATAAGKPDGDDLCVTTLPMSAIPTSLDWVGFGFGAGITLTGGLTYAIVVRATAAIYWRIRVGGSGYDGNSQYSVNAGVSWAGYLSDDYMFKEYGESGIETYEASEIGAFTAQGNGFLYDAANVTKVGFDWGIASGVYTDEVVDESGTYYAGLFGLTLTGLDSETSYYYRAKVYNTLYGWLYGNEMDFKTTKPTPRVRTDPPSDCQFDNVDGVGYIVSIGGANCDSRGFVYSLTSHSDPGEDVAPGDSDYDGFVLEEGDFGSGSFTLNIPNLQAGRIYYVRAWAHNSYGYDYGGQIQVLTNPDVNILYPTSDYSKGIRNDTGPGGHWPHHLAEGEARVDHYLLMRSKDCVGGPGTFGSIIGGGYIYERNDYNADLYTDLFGLANPYRRDEGILKVKWKANLMNNNYGYGDSYRKLYTHSTLYTGSDIGGAWPDGSYICEIFSTNPFSGDPWTLAEVDALIAGIELGHGGGWGTPACDWLCCYVLWANASVRTDPATKIAADSLRLKGYVLQDEAEECEVYFEWGLTTGYGNTTSAQTKRITEFFTADITGLDPLETYHYRAVIETACGETFYGEDAAFNLYRPDRIYAWLGDEAEEELVELTDPDYSMVLAARTERGWDEELAQASAGIAELTCDNYYGDFNPENAGGVYSGDLVLGKWLTIYEQYKGIKYPHFTGKIEKILPNDDPNDPTAYILAVDGMDDISATKVSTVLRQDTDVGELAEDALDACNWAAGKRDIDAGIDNLEYGWFHKTPGLDAFRGLETTEKGRFFIKRTGDARFENRHYRITGDGLISQHTFDNTAVRIQYEWSKRLLYNDVQVTGRRYFAGGIQLFSGYDMATLDSSLIWSAHTGDAAAPYVPQASTLVLWAEFGSPLSSYDALVKGTHWNANTSPDKTGDDVSDNITITPTQYGQAIKLSIANAGSMGAYIVEPDSPPDADTEGKTLLIYGVLFGSENMTVIEEDTDSQDAYGKRTLEIDAPFKSRPNDILAYAQWLKARYHLPIPNPVQLMHVARTGWPDDTLRIQCLVREISERITVASTKLGFDRDFYINKVIQEYAINEGGMVHDTTWVVEQAEGSAEGLYWLLGVAGFGELGDATILGF